MMSLNRQQAAKLHPRVKKALEKTQEPIYVYSDKDIENIENISVDDSIKYEVVQFPDPPISVQAHTSGTQSSIWWEYKISREPIIGWEVRRYKLDKGGSWSVKGVKQYKDSSSRKYTVTELEIDNFYRFTVSGINRHGKGVESRMSNSVYVEQPLPCGWFRSTASETPFFYFNLNTGVSSSTRPERDPYFIEDEAVVKLFKPHEVKNLRDIYDEEILHFDKVTKDRITVIMMELGERFTSRQIGTVFREYSKSPEAIFDYVTFMEIMYSLKIEATKSKNVSAQLAKIGSSLFCCCFGGVADVVESSQTSLVERVGDWEIRRANKIDRIFYCRNGSTDRQWIAPPEVRFYLPQNGLLWEIAESHFDPVELDLLKSAYCHMDVASNGRVNAVEFYRFMYIFCDPSRNPPGSDLPLNATQERSSIFTAVCGTCRYAYSFQDHLHFFIALRKNKKEDRDVYRSAMPSLASIVINRNTLLKVIETYLISRKDKKFEQEATVRKFSELDAIASSHKSQVVPAINMDAQEKPMVKPHTQNSSRGCGGADEDNKVRSFDDGDDEERGQQITGATTGGWFGGSRVRYTLGPKGEVLEHDICCMCGCRDRLYE